MRNTDHTAYLIGDGRSILIPKETRRTKVSVVTDADGLVWYVWTLHALLLPDDMVYGVPMKHMPTVKPVTLTRRVLRDVARLEMLGAGAL